MAVAVTAMQLENDLKLVEDDLGSFIESQKNSLLKDKLHLKRNIPSTHRKTALENDELALSLLKNENVLNISDGNNGLNLGGYENKQKKLRDERKQEYKQYLEQQHNMRGKKITIDTESQNMGNHIAQRFENRKEYKSNLDKEYGKLVKSKKNEESLYNLHYGVEDGSGESEKTGKKIIEFDDSDDELFNYVLKEKAKIKKQRSTSGCMRQPKPRNNDSPEDGRSSSVPPPKVPYVFGGSSHSNVRNIKNSEHKKALEEQVREKQILKGNKGNTALSTSKMPYIFGGSSHSMLRTERNIEHKEALEGQIKEKKGLKTNICSDTGTGSKVPYIFGGSSHAMMRKERNIEYKQALEEQIKEKEAEKMRQKLKRMGKLTSNTDIRNDENTQDEFSQYSEQAITKTNKTEDVPHHYNGNVENMTVTYPNQNGYPISPMYNPMMNYPIGWPAYGTMVPNGFVHNNMMGMQQVPTDMQRLNMDTHSKNNNYEKTVERYVPSALDNTVNIQQIPTDIHSKNNAQLNGSMKKYISPDNHTKPSGQYPGLVAIGGSSQLPDMSVKRAQQIAYQQELKQQMEIKKAAAEKDKQEREKYEMKLEKEIATYDPWGKSGCGAPVRNKDGNIVADLKKILQAKENGVTATPVDGNIIEAKLPDDLSPLLRALEMSQKTQELTEDNMGDMPQDETSPSYGRGAALKELQGLTMKSPRDKKEQTSYKQFLQQQVEEKKRKEEETKEKARLEEEKENKRLFEQQQRMREEYEQEKEKQRRKAEEIRKQNEALSRIAEQKKVDEEQKKRQIEDDRDIDRKREAEMKFTQNKLTSNEMNSPPKSNSPPVPAVTKTRRRSIQQEYHKQDVCTEHETMEYLNTIRNSLNKNRDEEIEKNRDDMQEQKHLIHQLSALRKQLMRQELKVQTDLKKNQQKYNLLSRTESAEQAKVPKRNPFDRATSITSGKRRHPVKLPTEYQLNDDNYDNVHRDLDTQQQEYMRQQEMRLLALRQGVESKTLPVDFQINRQPSKQSLLESESKFISLDNHQEVKNFKAVNGSGHRKENIEDDNLSIKLLDNNIADTASLSTLKVEDIARKTDERLINLKVGDIALKTKERLKKLENDNIIDEFMQNKQYDVT